MPITEISCDALTSEEACAYLKIPLPTLYRYNHLKLITRYKMGKKCYYKLEDLRNFLFQEKNKIAAVVEKEE